MALLGKFLNVMIQLLKKYMLLKSLKTKKNTFIKLR
jgi:hypothetical protein